MHLNSVRPKHRLPKKKREKLMARRLTGNFGETDGLGELNGMDEERVSNENRFRG